MKKLTVYASAKLNLFLKILSKRPDGFHDIETVYEKISLCDRLTFCEIPRPTIELSCNHRGLSCGKDNLVYKAAELIRKAGKVKTGASIVLEKNIPLQGGLGGGSSDAVATLKGLNQLWRLGFSRHELIGMAKTLGSDMPLFAFDENFLLGTGRGDEITPIAQTNTTVFWHIIMLFRFGVPTPLAYKLFDQKFLDRKGGTKGQEFSGKMKLTIPDYSASIIIRALQKRDFSLLNYYSYNSFENVIVRRFPQLAQLKRFIEKESGLFVRLTGSGSTLFVTLSGSREAEHLRQKIQRTFSTCQVSVVRTHKQTL